MNLALSKAFTLPSWICDERKDELLRENFCDVKLAFVYAGFSVDGFLRARLRLHGGDDEMAKGEYFSRCMGEYFFPK